MCNGLPMPSEPSNKPPPWPPNGIVPIDTLATEFVVRRRKGFRMIADQAVALRRDVAEVAKAQPEQWAAERERLAAEVPRMLTMAAKLGDQMALVMEEDPAEACKRINPTAKDMPRKTRRTPASEVKGRIRLMESYTKMLTNVREAVDDLRRIAPQEFLPGGQFVGIGQQADALGGYDQLMAEKKTPLIVEAETVPAGE